MLLQEAFAPLGSLVKSLTWTCHIKQKQKNCRSKSPVQKKWGDSDWDINDYLKGEAELLNSVIFTFIYKEDFVCSRGNGFSTLYWNYYADTQFGSFFVVYLTLQMFIANISSTYSYAR